MADDDARLGGLLPRRDLPDEEAEARLIAGLEEALGHPERQRVPAGTVLLRAGEEPRHISLLVDGRVELRTATPEGDEVLLHAASTGPIIGLGALTRSGRAAFTVRAATEAVLLPVTVAELDRVLRDDTELARLFVDVVVRSLARRHHRAVELQVENASLAKRVAADRDRLEDALARLEAAQDQLVASARMATLGEMAAGLAHELNNPVAAITRAADFVAEDVGSLVAEGPRGPWRAAVLERALRRPARSTAEHRRRRAALADAVGDHESAERLLAAGIDDADEARALLREVPAADREALLDDLGRLRRLGDALRNLASASERVADLVASLRAHARAGGGERVDVDVAEGLEDTLRLLGHRLEGVDVVRDYQAVPAVRADPGELGQVWTNLVVNALDAMGDEGRLVLRVRRDGGHVVVEVADSGPGMADDEATRAFEPHFTTKAGRVTYGLGLGLPISQRIVDRHGGTIALSSEPSGTTATVSLPAHEEQP